MEEGQAQSQAEPGDANRATDPKLSHDVYLLGGLRTEAHRFLSIARAGIKWLNEG
jgi:hypothetical protein